MAERSDCEPDAAVANGGREMSLVGHLQELRRRIIIILIALGAGSTICYFYAAEIVQVLTAPAGKLYYFSPAEAFFSYLKVSVFGGFLLVLPVVLYQIWAFIVPALTGREKHILALLLPSSVTLFFAGVAFSYFLVLPAGVRFFLNFTTETLQPLFSLGQYLSFVISFLLPFGLVFELPLFILGLAKMGIISSRWLAARRKIMIVLSFIIGAVISPSPDVVSQTMVAVPVMLLYEVSILAVRHLMGR